MIVADVSIVLAFIMHDESEPYADAAVELLCRDGAAIPGNFHGEVANALLQAERRGRIDAAHATAALAEILALPWTIDMPDPQLAMRLARKHRLTCYDAFYLALATQLDLPLATVDAALAAAASSSRLYWEPPT